jgi:VacB/RNase II family 3'-5' exoribonuclease
MNQLTISELNELAKQTIVENGFQAEMPAEVLEAANSIDESETISALSSHVQDLRSLLWSSIDNKTSRDLDQVEFAEVLEGSNIRLLVGIADVDEFVPKGSVIDEFARQNTTSVYAGGATFPMLPARFSTDLTSLKEGFDRAAIVTEMIIDSDGNVVSGSVFQALVHNYAKLTYEEIGAWLDGQTEIPESVTKTSGLKEQILVQQKAASFLYKLRKQNGALEFETVESAPIVSGKIISGIEIVHTNSARKIIENFMIAANVQMARFLENRNVASLRRVVKTPEQWEQIVKIVESFGERLPDEPDSKALADFLARRRAADPVHYPDLSLSIIKLIGAGEYVVQAAGIEEEGHFGLAVQDYTHSTAPNRRYVDLIVQRLVKAALESNPAPYDLEELNLIADHCNKMERAAKKVERKVRKISAASVMKTRIGEIFEAIVTGKTQRGTFARILRPPVDGRIVEGEETVEVGEKIRVRLLAANSENGFIDFENIS